MLRRATSEIRSPRLPYLSTCLGLWLLPVGAQLIMLGVSGFDCDKQMSRACIGSCAQARSGPSSIPVRCVG
jgi:hypothetical protein